MSIRPIDMQTILPKAQEHKQTKETVQNKVQNDQNIVQEKIQIDAERSLNRVPTYEQKDAPTIKDDKSDNSGMYDKNEQESENQDFEDEGSPRESDFDQESFLKNEEKMAELSIKNKQYSNDKKLKSQVFHKFDLKV